MGFAALCSNILFYFRKGISFSIFALLADYQNARMKVIKSGSFHVAGSICVSCVIMLFISLAGGSRAYSQTLEINAPGFANKNISITAFSGLTTDTLFQSWLDGEGRVVVPIKKEGFILIDLNGKQVYPMIYMKMENRFLLRENGMPDFTGFPQNSFFFRHLIHRNELLNQRRMLDESMRNFSADDSLTKAFQSKQNRISSELLKYSSLCKDSSGYTGSVFISAEQLLESSYGIHTEEELAQKKKEFRQFIHDHYSIISTSDQLQQYANQYMMMNEYVLVGKEKMENQVAQDIGDWKQLLKEHYNGSEVVQYFLHYFISRLMVTMAGSIYEKFPDLSACPVPKEQLHGNKLPITASETRIDVNTLEKLLNPGEKKESIFVIMNVDCPASIAGQVLLNRYIAEQGVSVNVITVFCGKTPGQADYRMIPDPGKTVFMQKVLTGIGDHDLKIQKYPAFVIMNNSGQLGSIDYTLAGIRKKIIKLKTAE